MKQNTGFLLRLGLLGMTALVLSLTPVQSWGGGVACNYDCNDVIPVSEDTTLDTDGDGFRDHFECCAYKYKYYDTSPILIGTFDPNVPDLFVVVTKDEDALEPGNILEYVSNDPTWIKVHKIEESKVGPISYDPGPDPADPNPLPEGFRRVSPGSMQRVVRLHLSDLTDAISCPIPADLKVGMGNVGTTMHPNAGGTVFTRQIERKVRCLYLEAGIISEPGTEPWPLEMQTHIEKYIRHTAAHELFHNLHLRYLLVPGDKGDVREYNKYEEHYSDRTANAIMAQRVIGSVSKSAVTLDIGTDFIESDTDDALYHMTILAPPPPAD